MSDKPTLEYDAELHNWTRVGGTPWQPYPHYIGSIYADKKARFGDGVGVSTSRIVSGPDENNIVQTKSTRYLLVGAEVGND